jgi:hypothetical protein
LAVVNTLFAHGRAFLPRRPLISDSLFTPENRIVQRGRIPNRRKMFSFGQFGRLGFDIQNRGGLASRVLDGAFAYQKLQFWY